MMKKKKIDLARKIVEADRELGNDGCRYPEDHYGCYIREWSKLVDLSEDILKKRKIKRTMASSTKG